MYSYNLIVPFKMEENIALNEEEGFDGVDEEEGGDGEDGGKW